MAKTKVTNDKIAKKIMQTDKRINTVVFVFALLFFSAFVLIVFKDYTNITLVKYNTFLFITLGLALYYAYEKGSIALSNGYFKNVSKKDFTPYIFITLFLIFNIFSCVFSPYMSNVNGDGKSILLFGGGRYDGLIVLLLFIVLFLIFSFEKIFSVAFINVVAISTFATLIIGFLQLCGFNPLDFYPTSNFYETGRAFTTTLGNIDVVSTYLCIVFSLLAFSYIAIKQNAYLKFFWLFTYFISIVFLLKIDVDSGKLALITIFAIALPILSRKKEYFLKLLDVLSVTFLSLALAKSLQLKYDVKLSFKFNFSKTVLVLIISSIAILIIRILLNKFLKEKHTKALFFVILSLEIIVIIAGAIFIKNHNDFENETLSQLSLLLNGKADDSFGSHRLGLYKYTLLLCKERLFLGYGTGTFRIGFYEFAKQLAPEFASGSYDFVHNEYIQILYNCGILGLISYLCFLGYLILKSFKSYLKNEKIMVLLFVTLCYLIQAFFTFSIVIVSPLFWILLGMLSFEIRTEQRKKCEF